MMVGKTCQAQIYILFPFIFFLFFTIIKSLLVSLTLYMIQVKPWCLEISFGRCSSGKLWHMDIGGLL